MKVFGAFPAPAVRQDGCTQLIFSLKRLLRSVTSGRNDAASKRVKDSHKKAAGGCLRLFYVPKSCLLQDELSAIEAFAILYTNQV